MGYIVLTSHFSLYFACHLHSHLLRYRHYGGGTGSNHVDCKKPPGFNITEYTPPYQNQRYCQQAAALEVQSEISLHVVETIKEQH